MKRNHCLICGGQHLTKILDLGNHPYADTFIAEKDNCNLLPVYKLSCVLCQDCGQVQTESVTNPEDRYNLYDYSYTSSNSSVSRSHWQNYSQDVISKLSVKEKDRICEIGSNDGFLLDFFKQHGAIVLGIDASKKLVEISNSNGIPAIQKIFSLNISDEILKSHPKFDVVVANNVFNHADEPISFSKGVKNLLKSNGHFVFEVPYWKSTIDSQKIDQVYHEHVSYFTATSVKKMMEKIDFSVVDIEVVDYHGGSLRVYAQKSDNIEHCEKLYDLMKNESYLFDEITYDNLITDLQRKKHLFLKDLFEAKVLKNIPIVAIGAAAKGNTFLNYMNLNSTLVDYVTDSSPLKQGKSTPLTNIPITSDEILSKYDDVYAIILSWNLSDKIKQKLHHINKNIKFINFYKDYQ